MLLNEKCLYSITYLKMLHIFDHLQVISYSLWIKNLFFHFLFIFNHLSRLVRGLLKKLSERYVFIAQRRILPKPTRKTKLRIKLKCPFWCVSVVFSNIILDSKYHFFQLYFDNCAWFNPLRFGQPCWDCWQENSHQVGCYTLDQGPYGQESADQHWTQRWDICCYRKLGEKFWIFWSLSVKIYWLLP
jgi:hypothetical protein